MSKKILILSGSPRKVGNSDYLCDKFSEGARDAGHVVEKIFVSEKKIGYCTGRRQRSRIDDFWMCSCMCVRTR